jgi:putative ABC transport system permease protein
MNLLKISWKHLRSKPLDMALSLMLLAFGVGIISMLLLVEKQLREQFERNIKDIDLVLGAKGSPLQLILSSVYQIDAPTGNISKSQADQVIANPLIEEGIPLSFGDNFEKYRIVGSDHRYVNHYGAELAEGKLWQESLEAVLGSRVAKETGLKTGSEFLSSHGLDEAGEKHDNHHFTVVGILEPCGCVLDQLVLTSHESIWELHPQEDSAPDSSVQRADTTKQIKRIGFAAMQGSMKPPSASDDKREYTAVLLKKRNAMALLTIPQTLKETNMQVALPAVEINRLNADFGSGAMVIQSIAIVIMVLSFISVFISLFNSLRERKYELALMRSMGGTRMTLFRLIIQEGVVLALLGALIGFVVSRLGLWLLANLIEENFNYDISDMSLLPAELILFGITIFTGILASFLPAWKAIRIDISKTLSDG